MRYFVLAVAATAAAAAVVPVSAHAFNTPTVVSTSGYIVTTSGPATRVLGLVRPSAARSALSTPAP